MILIAGGFCDRHVWDEMLEPLSKNYKVVTYDNRGIGQSDHLVDDYSIAVLADDLNCLLAQLGISSVHIVGHSMGGFVAQYFAAFFPEKTKSLSLLSSLLAMNKEGRNFLDNIVNSLHKMDLSSLRMQCAM